MNTDGHSIYINRQNNAWHSWNYRGKQKYFKDPIS